MDDERCFALGKVEWINYPSAKHRPSFIVHRPSSHRPVNNKPNSANYKKQLRGPLNFSSFVINSRVMRCVWFFLLLWTYLPLAFAQGPVFHFEKFTMENGLSDNRVATLVADTRGFLWIGTYNGLNRFDGRNFKQYFNQPGAEGSISSNLISGLFQEPNGDIRISTHNGYNHYHPETDRFTTYLTYPAEIGKLGEANLYGSQKHSDGSFWVVNYLGKVSRYWPSTKLLEPLPFPAEADKYPGITEQTRSFGIRVFGSAISGDTVCWIGFTYGLMRYHLPSKTFRFFPQKTSSYGTFVRVLPNGRVLLTVWEEGLFYLDPGETALKRLYPKQTTRPDNIVWDVLPQPNGNYWLACEGGLFDLNIPEGTMSRIPLPVDGRFPSRVNCFAHGAGGILWMGTENGLIKLDPKLQGFHYLPLRSDSQQVYENDIYGIQLIENQLFAISRQYYGLYVLPLNKPYSRAEFIPTPDHNPSCLMKDRKGRYWLTTWNGLYLFDPATRKMTDTHPPPRREGRKGINWALAEHPHNGRLWCGSSRDGIFEYDPETGQSRHFSCETDGFCALDVRDIVFDRNGNRAWVSTIGSGLWEQDLNTGKWTNLTQKNSPILPSDYTSDIVQDHDGRLWIGSLNGLVRYDWRKKPDSAFLVLSTRNGLPSNFMEGLQVDRSGHIWAGTANRLVRIHPDQLSISIFDHRFGTDVTPYPINSISVLADGRLAGGGKGGVLLWNPDSLLMLPPSGKLFMTGVEVLGKSFASDVPMENLQTLELDYWQNVLTLHFTSLHFTLPDNERFAWKLAGYDRDWVQGGSLRTAVYTRLPPGDYVFMVKTGNLEGVWSSENRLLNIHISPAFWQTTWFKWLVATLLAAAAWMAYRWRIRQIEAREALKTAFQKKIAEVEMAALRAQMNPHFVFNCLNSINSFIQLSHPDTASGYLTKFSRLIRLVLDNSREELVPLDQELEALRLYVELESLRFDGRFRFDIQIHEGLDVRGIDIPPLLIQPYVENAIWHGLMHKTNDDGALQMRLYESNGKLVVEIHDNGVGREEAARLKSKSATHRKSLGMTVTRERMEILRQIYQNDISVDIQDLKLPDGQSGGTLVVLRMDI